MIDLELRRSNMKAEVECRVLSHDRTLPIWVEGIQPSPLGMPVAYDTIVDLNVQALMDDWQTEPTSPAIYFARVLIEGIAEAEHGSWDIEDVYEGLWFMKPYQILRIASEKSEGTEDEDVLDAHVRGMKEDLIRAHARSCMDTLIAFRSIMEEME